jgi:hypothetical protein
MKPIAFLGFLQKHMRSVGFSPDAAVDEVARTRSRLSKLEKLRTYEGFAASITFAGGRLVGSD